MPIMTYDAEGNEIDITPVAHREKDWAKNINSADDLFTQFENAQALVGRSVQLPGETATGEDWNAVFNKLGRPESVDGYEINAPADSDEATKQQVNGLKELFHKQGVTKKQATSLIEGFQSMSKAQQDALLAAQATKDSEFEKLVNSIFGDKADEAKKVSRNLLDKFAPDALKDKLKDMSETQMTAVAAVLKGITDKYISQDDLRDLGGMTASSGKSIDSLKKEAREIMASEAYTNQMHVDHASAVAKSGELYKQVVALQKKQV